MKTRISILSVGLFMFGAYSCEKDDSTSAIADEATGTTEISVAASDSAPTTDSVTFEHQCGAGITRDSVAESALPTSVAEYLAANYEGYTFHKALTEADSAGTVDAYIVVIYYEDKPVGLEFDNEGLFVEILRQRRSGHHRR